MIHEQEEAQRLAAALRANSDDVHFRRIDWDTFGDRNEAIWNEAHTNPRVEAMVLGILRDDPHWKEEDMTEKKRKSRKKARTVTATKDEANSPAKDAQNAPVAPKEAKEREPRPEMCVFAIRLLPEERDLIHAATGPGGASKFVRSLAVAASRGDAEAVAALMQTVKPSS